MNKEQKYFTGVLDADSEASFVDKSAWVNSENVRYGTTDFGVTKTIESVGGTSRLSTASPSVTFTCIGSIDDTPNFRILYFLYNTTTTQHKILCHEILTGLEYNVLLSAQIEGGLNFDKDQLIHSARVVGKLLIWPNAEQNEIKCINIDAAIKTNHPSYITTEDAYTTPIKYEVTTLIKRPPIYRLQIQKEADSSFDNNLIKNEAFQFTCRYVYKDNQRSALAAFSALAPFNSPDATTNCIDVNLSLSEQIPDDAQQVDMCVRFGNTGRVGIIKRYNKSNASDLAAINAHNAGTAALEFRFYNDVQPTYLGDDEIISFDNIPLYAYTLELARYRLFLGNFVRGYDAPTESSLTVSLTNVDTGSAGSIAGTWGYITLHANYTDSGLQDSFMFPFFRRTSDNTLYYFPSVRNSSIWNGGVGSVPATINLSEATQQAVSEATLAAYLKATNYPTGGSVGSPVWDVAYDISFASLGAATVLLFTATSVNQFFKSNSAYLVNIAFYDRFRRKCGVIKTPVQASIPIRSWNQTTFTTILQWTLSNTNAADEIPDWAYYYQIHITKNQTTRNFLQTRVYNSTYVKKSTDPASPFVFGNANYSDTTYAVGFDISSLFKYGLGYQFAEGDFANVWFTTGDPITLPVIGQYGNYVLLAPTDFGFGLNADTSALIEIYTPYKTSLNEEYYEVGDVYVISNPTTSGRAYSTLVGQINGDTYALQRKDKNGGVFPNQLYIVEAMSPNDIKWKEWNTDTGWPNLILDIGQVHKENSILWTNTFIEGSRINGLNKIMPLNEMDLDNEMGALNKLQLVSKVQGEIGTVMLQICTRETGSSYLGEVQQYGSDSESELTLSTQVMSKPNVLRGSYGTLDPQSVTIHRGSAFWLDRTNGKYIRYADNGLYPISNDLMTRFWKRFCDQYNSMTIAQIEALGSFPYVVSAVDPRHNELVISIPKLSNIPPKGYLPDYPSTIYPFDILDFQTKTLVYKMGGNQAESENNRWQGAYTFAAENFIAVANNLYSFKTGQLYLHNQTNYNQFYGVNYQSKIMVLSNSEPDVPKSYNAMSIQANITPSLTYFRSEWPYTQASDLVDFNWTNLEGVLYATLYRNKLVPTAVGLNTDGLLTAEKMRTNVLRILIQFNITTTPLELRFLTFGYDISRGHTL
jgi:hypothetical protein